MVQTQRATASAIGAALDLPYPVNPGSVAMYPGLGDFMGLELSEDVIRLNMPEYLSGPPQTAVAIPSQVGTYCIFVMRSVAMNHKAYNQAYYALIRNCDLTQSIAFL